ncbi:FtsK/SpoIIIE family DNA translocase [Salinicoccus albus]|uniref:FtsK/SpoIIIE family DNA translocase n=1 Tax=Salinicoccus albus TaxID=418756 RepID=UPI0003608A02|nr:DNA translocase FtsK [Salinicoccus albus]
MARKRKKTKKNNRTYYSISAFILIVILFISVFQLGVIGTYIDAFFAYLFGTSRYFTYLIMFLASIYLAAEQKIPFTKRMTGYILLQFGLLFLFHSILYMANRARIENYFTLGETVETIQSDGIMHFFGGGIIGQLLFTFSSTGVSFAGSLLLGLIFIYFSFLIIASKDIEQSLSKDLSRLGALLQKAGLLLIAGVQQTGRLITNLLRSLFNSSNSQKGKKETKDKPEKGEASASKKQPKQRDENQKPKQLSDFEPDESLIEDMHSFDREEQTEAGSGNAASQKASDRQSAGNAEKEQAKGPEIAEDSNEPQKIEYESDDPGSIPQDHESEEVGEGGFATFEDHEYNALKQYQVPSITMLNDAEVSEKVSNKEVLEQGRVLEETLNNFGVKAKVSKIRIGPAVTQFEIQPDVGVKVSRIINLQNDIALSLAAKDIRIEAPIPGKSAVGIEVPNSVVSTVTLREVLKRNTSDNPLEVALGKDISGSPITAELNKMPHLLVAGATGSGKSVAINGIILSLLMKAKPHEVKLMMIDPKMVELNVYNGIPHLLSPVVTNPQKANDALNKIVSEMERRYDLFSHSGTRNIEAYNQYLERESDTPEKVQKLPYIVVIIDELADLMLVASKDVEASITRIAQMARAAGIHMIIATQRPSVDVITGIIKANIPSRIAFSVSSNTDSRTIIDSQGAEKLLGRGDMLFLPSGRSKPLRVQGVFLSDDEVTDVVEYITGQMKANYEKSIMNKPVQKEETESEDELYPDAKWFVIEEQRASASLLQRQFRIGYNRAARLVDDLEANGIIGPSSGSKPRNVLIQNEE